MKIKGVSKNLFQSRPSYHILIVLWFVLLAILLNIKPLCDGILFESYDAWLHLFWLDQFFQQMSAGTVYPHWLANANYGMGSPAFVFYPPLVYFVGSTLRLLVHMSTEHEFILLQTLAAALAGLSANYFLRSKFDAFTAGVAATFYAASPFFMYDSYMRGALCEIFTFAELPLILWCTDLVLRERKYMLVFSLSWAALILTSLPITLLTVVVWPLYLAGAIFGMERTNRPTVKTLGCMGLSGALAFALTSFYLIPALAQRTLIAGTTWLLPAARDTTYNGTEPAMTPIIFPVFLFLTVSGLVLTAAALAYRKSMRKPISQMAVLGALIVLLAVISIALQLPAWGLVHASLFNAMLFACCSSTALAHFRTDRQQNIETRGPRLLRTLCLIVLLQLIISSFLSDFLLAKYRRGLHGQEPQMLEFDVDKPLIKAMYTKRSQVLQPLLQQHSCPPDAPEYTPLIQKAVPPAAAEHPTQLVFSEARATVQRWDSYNRKLIAMADKPCPLAIRTYYFPGWNCYLDDRRVSIRADDLGRIQIDLAQGFHTIQFKFEQSGWERLGIIISAIAGAAVFMHFASMQFTKSKQIEASIT